MPDPATVEPLVVGTGLGRTFGDLVALDGATFTIPAGARIALVGPSGCGKSTLLHLIAGLDTPTSGALAWPALGPKESLRPLHVGFVFQAPSLVAPLTVVENVELPLLLEHRAPAEARTAALAVLCRRSPKTAGFRTTAGSGAARPVDGLRDHLPRLTG